MLRDQVVKIMGNEALYIYIGNLMSTIASQAGQSVALEWAGRHRLAASCV